MKTKQRSAYIIDNKKYKLIMSLSNRSFRNNSTGEVVKVIDSFENIAILENKTKIDTRRLLDPSFFTEEIDPSKFLDTRPAYNSIFEEIKKLPTNNIPDDNGEIKPTVQMDSRYIPPVEEDSAVIYTTVDDEKEELARKYGVNPNPVNAISRQNEAFARILGEDSPETTEIASQAPMPATNRPVRYDSDPVQRIDVDRNQGISKPIAAEVPVSDPVVDMFKGIKRSVDFTLDVKLENKIPKLEFIELMEDSYERSLIEYLAEEFANELIKNPESLKQSIAGKIREMVYGKPKPAPKRQAKPNTANRSAAVKKPAVKKPSPKKQEEEAPKPVAKRAPRKKEAEQE